MGTQVTQGEVIQEQCSSCGGQRPHDVEITLRTESDKDGKKPDYSREPYRRTECQDCGETTETRLNNA